MIPGWLPEWVRVAIVLLFSGVGAYFIRQFWEAKKLRRALKVEVSSMEGIKNCAESMESRDYRPSNIELKPSDVPPAGSIPTLVYESNVSRLGLLSESRLEKFVEFYSEVLQFKSIMKAIRDGEDVSEPDQEQLYEEIGELENQRQRLFGEGWID